jgi:hypothetical protein
MTFNLKYLRLFRTLQTVKQMMGPAMTSFLETCAHLPEFKQASAYTPGRCVPALSFVFNMVRSLSLCVCVCVCVCVVMCVW